MFLHSVIYKESLLVLLHFVVGCCSSLLSIAVRVKSNLGLSGLHFQVTIHYLGDSAQECKQELKQKPWKDAPYCLELWSMLS